MLYLFWHVLKLTWLEVIPITAVITSVIWGIERFILGVQPGDPFVLGYWTLFCVVGFDFLIAAVFAVVWDHRARQLNIARSKIIEAARYRLFAYRAISDWTKQWLNDEINRRKYLEKRSKRAR